MNAAPKAETLDQLLDLVAAGYIACSTKDCFGVITKATAARRATCAACDERAEANADIRAALIAEANEQNAQFPQYKGHWDNYRLGTATREVKTKMGIACLEGATVLFAPHSGLGSEPGDVVFYSRSNRIDTIVRAATIKEIK